MNAKRALILQTLGNPGLLSPEVGPSVSVENCEIGVLKRSSSGSFRSHSSIML